MRKAQSPVSSPCSAAILGMFDTGVAVGRALGRAGVRVQGYDSDSRMPGFRSRYCHASACPHPVTAPQELLALLLRDAAREDVPRVLYPCADEYVGFVSRFRSQLQAGYRFVLPSPELTEAILDKEAQLRLVAGVGIEVPPLRLLAEGDDIASVRDALRYPVFVKPVHGHEWRGLFKDKGFKATSPGELEAVWEKIRPSRIRVLVQEVIPGPCTRNIEVSAYAGQSGKILASETIRKGRQYPSEFGFGTLIESAHNPEVERLAGMLFEKLRWLGYANVEFKYDDRDGRYKFIEVNARVWQHCSHAEWGGVNFPLLQYLDLTGQDPSRALGAPRDSKWMDLKWDTVSALKMIVRHELTVREWLKSLKGVRSFGLFAADDPVPFLRSIGYGGALLRAPRLLLRASKRG